MMISDLQQIESATETEVQGGGSRRRWRWRPSNPGYAHSETLSLGVYGTDALIAEDQFDDSYFYDELEELGEY